MTPADRRITELIDKWLASIDLHLSYVELSDAAYARVQPWPRHDRPTRWVLEVARQKLLELKAQCETRQAMGDGKFSESLELMAFLANLVGIQHIERFIPLADPARSESASSTSQTVEVLPVAKGAPSRPLPVGEDTTREMPRLKPAPAKPPAAMQARAAATSPAVKSSGDARSADGTGRNGTAAARAASAARTDRNPDIRSKIIADAVRLLKWGKPWHELAELIARIAERPPEPEVRKVLRAHKGEIEQRAAEG